jgi:HEPN superfamily AbiU2-like protein
MWDEVLLHLARLVDPPMSLGRADKTNLTLQALPTAIRDSAPALKVYPLVEEARSRCAFAKDWRDRRYAHHDLELALRNPGTVPLARAERTDVEAALESIRAALGAVHGHYLHMDPGFERFSAPADADWLLDHLRRSRGSSG